MGPFADGWTEADIEAALVRNDPAEVLYVPVLVSMDPPDCAWAEAVCVRLAVHPDAWVRANAIRGFGHLARTCQRLNESIVRTLVEAGLCDSTAEVRAGAQDATDDIRTFLGWATS